MLGRIGSTGAGADLSTLYDVGREDGVDFLVMEYLEGETLVGRLTKGPLPLGEALRYSIEIAAALDKAHQQGVVHRDLKPGNIMLTKSGAQLLDFGLAKLRVASAQGMDLSALPTADKPLTDEGTIRGTLQYMAPEQLEGKTVDARTDLFAFGAVVYEMVTGKRAFEGKTQASLIGAIMEQDPVPMATLQPVTPPTLDRVVKKCLSKDPDERWHSAHDLRDELEWIVESGTGVEPGPMETGPRRQGRIAWALSAVLLALVVILAGAYFYRVPQERRVTRITFPPPPEAFAETLKVSPDGERLAFIVPNTEGVSTIGVRDLESGETQVLAGTEGVAQLFWSPDSRFVGFSTHFQLKKIDLSRGPPETLRDVGFSRGGTWNEEGVMVLSNNTGLHRVLASGGQPGPVRLRDEFSPETLRKYPYFLPDGVHFLYFAYSAFEQGQIYVGSLESEETTFVVASDSKAVYADGYLLFVQDGVLMAQRFDTEKLRLEGEPRVLGQQMMSPSILAQDTPFSVSRNGVLAFRSGSRAAGQLVWFDRQGRELGRVPQPSSGEYVNPSLSPDGQRLR